MLHVSVTGLTVRSPLVFPLFAFHAVRSMMQARKADGVLHAEARRVGGVHHTLTVWRSREHMRAYMTSGAHRKAMGAFARVGSGLVHGYAAESVPTFEAALAEWRRHGRAVGARPAAPVSVTP